MSGLSYWKCRKCHGTGKTIWQEQVNECSACDGTGNALVDGEARRHLRRVRELELKKLGLQP